MSTTEWKQKQTNKNGRLPCVVSTIECKKVLLVYAIIYELELVEDSKPRLAWTLTSTVECENDQSRVYAGTCLNTASTNGCENYQTSTLIPAVSTVECECQDVTCVYTYIAQLLLIFANGKSLPDYWYNVHDWMWTTWHRVCTFFTKYLGLYKTSSRGLCEHECPRLSVQLRVCVC